jgi:hypothetical protein
VALIYPRPSPRASPQRSYARPSPGASPHRAPGRHRTAATGAPRSQRHRTALHRMPSVRHARPSVTLSVTLRHTSIRAPSHLGSKTSQRRSAHGDRHSSSCVRHEPLTNRGARHRIRRPGHFPYDHSRRLGRATLAQTSLADTGSTRSQAEPVISAALPRLRRRPIPACRRANPVTCLGGRAWSATSRACQGRSTATARRSTIAPRTWPRVQANLRHVTVVDDLSCSSSASR